MRLFFALWPPRETALALERWAQAVDGRRTPADKIHLTLAFLGEADAGKASAAAGRVQAAGFRLPLEEARHWAHNQIVWAGPHRVPDELARLVEALQVELYKEAFILERRPFAAHVTLVRKAAARSRCRRCLAWYGRRANSRWSARRTAPTGRWSAFALS